MRTPRPTALPSHRKRPLARVPWIWAVPGLLLVLAFHVVPVIVGARYAFTNWNGFGTAKGIGTQNFTSAFSDSITRGALFHTLEYAGCFVVLANCVGLALAIALERTLRTRNILRALFFAPAVISPLAVGYVWSYIFSYDGALNDVLHLLGLSSWERPWTGDPHWAMWTIVVALVWQYSGLAMAIYLAGLTNISEELREAAATDGAGHWFMFRQVLLPLLAPAFTISIAITTIFGLRVFDQIIAITGGGPAYATETLATQIYTQTFVVGRYGFGAALGLILTAVIAIVVFTQIFFLRRYERRA
jgi:raffinose/stachyose/melibiose transport system permease protein